MADSLRDWLSTSAEGELDLAISYLNYASPCGIEITRTHPTSTNESLVVHRTGQNEVVQVIEFCGSKRSPYTNVSVCDNKSEIRVSFAKLESDKIKRDYKPLHKLSGLVLVLHEYDFVISPSSKPGQQVTLAVNRFTFLRGTEGSAVLNQPRYSVEEPIKIRQRLETLLVMMLERARTTIRDGSLSPVLSQVGDYHRRNSHDAGRLSSPDVFLTQAGTANGRNVARTGEAVLLELLGPTKPVAKVTRISEQPEPPLHGNPQAGATDRQMRSPGPEVRVPSGPVSSYATNDLSSHTARHLDPSLDTAEVRKRKRSDSFDLDNESEKENSQERLKSLAKMYLEHDPSTAPSLPDYEKKRKRQGFHTEIHPSAGGRKRVPRSFILVPPDQQELLDRDDSWFHPSSGSQPEVANIPPRVRARLEAFSNRLRPQSVNRDDLDGSTVALDRENGTVTAPRLKTPEVDNVNPLISRDDSQDDSDELSWASSPPRHLQRAPSSARSALKSARSTAEADLSSPPRDQVETESIISEQQSPKLPSQTSTGAEAADREVTGPALSHSLPPPGPRTFSHVVPSSPASDDELDLAVPYALNEIVESSCMDVHDKEVPAIRFPSTAGPPHLLVQVERTPSGACALDSRSVPGDSRNQLTLSGNDVQSDTIVPATFDETRQMARSQSETACSPKRGDYQGYCSSPSSSFFHMEVEAGLREQYHLEFNASPNTCAGAPRSVGSSPRQSNIISKTFSTRPTDSARAHSYDGPGPEPFPPLKPYDSPSAPSGILPNTNSSRGNRRVLSRGPPSKKRKSHRVPIFDVSPSQDISRDPSEMAKANRRQFMLSLGASNETAQGANHNAVSTPGTAPYQPAAPATSTGLSSNSGKQAHPSVENSDATDDNAPAPLPVSEVEAQVSEVSEMHEPSEVPHSSATGTSSSERSVSRDARSPSGSAPAETPMIDNIYENFRTAYPFYECLLDSFICAIVYLEDMHRRNRGLHHILWDDFIGIWGDYREHVQECRSSKQTPPTGVEYYNKHIDEPRFTKRVIKPLNLNKALLENPKETKRAQRIVRIKHQSQESAPTQSRDEAPFLSTQTPSTQSQDTCTGLDPFLPSNGRRASTTRLNEAQESTNLKPATKAPFFETPSQIRARPPFDMDLSETAKWRKSVGLPRSSPIAITISKDGQPMIDLTREPPTITRTPRRASTPQYDQKIISIDEEPQTIFRTQASPILGSISPPLRSSGSKNRVLAPISRPERNFSPLPVDKTDRRKTTGYVRKPIPAVYVTGSAIPAKNASRRVSDGATRASLTFEDYIQSPFLRHRAKYNERNQNSPTTTPEPSAVEVRPQKRPRRF